MEVKKYLIPNLEEGWVDANSACCTFEEIVDSSSHVSGIVDALEGYVTGVLGDLDYRSRSLGQFTFSLGFLPMVDGEYVSGINTSTSSDTSALRSAILPDYFCLYISSKTGNAPCIIGFAKPNDVIAELRRRCYNNINSELIDVSTQTRLLDKIATESLVVNRQRVIYLSGVMGEHFTVPIVVFDASRIQKCFDFATGALLSVQGAADRLDDVQNFSR